MQRRSTRLKNQPVSTLVQDTEDNDPGSMDTEPADKDNAVQAETKAPSRKRKVAEEKEPIVGQPSTKKPRGRCGMLKEMLEMPLDVLFEIFGQLNPFDLLHLARTSKDLRAILMSRASITLWRRARSNVDGLPDCPDDLNEPQYAELAFGKRCYYCGRSSVSNITVWEARIRGCTKCLKDHFLPPRWAEPTFRQLSRLLPVLELRISSRKDGPEKCYYMRHYDAWKKRLNKLKTEHDRQRWIARRVKKYATVEKHAKACLKWMAKVQTDLEAAQQAIFKQRQARVREHIVKMGWGDEINKIPRGALQPEDDPPVRASCRIDLTEQALINLEPRLNALMANIQEVRLAREHKSMLRHRISVLAEVTKTSIASMAVNDSDTFWPTASDLLPLPLVQDIINRDPERKEFSAEQFAVVCDSFPDLVALWREGIRDKLVSMALKGRCIAQYAEVEAPNILELAATGFKCVACPTLTSWNGSGGALRYPQVQTHPCTTKLERDQDEEFASDFLGSAPWNRNGDLRFDKNFSEIAGAILTDCGLDPSTITNQVIEHMNPIFECLTCNDDLKGRATMTWRVAPCHYQEFHSGLPPGHKRSPKFRLLSDEQEKKKTLECLYEQAARVKRSQLLQCTLCQSTTYVRWPIMKEHVKQIHGKTTGIDDYLELAFYPYERRKADIYWLWPPRDESEEQS